jgi:translation elongation factor EF-1alpha
LSAICCTNAKACHAAREKHLRRSTKRPAGPACSIVGVLDKMRCSRERGITTDPTMWRMETAHYDVTLWDTPGYREFVSHGGCGAVVVVVLLLLVVPALQGEFEAGMAVGGQT